MIAEVCRRLHHAPRVARGAHAAAFAGIGHEVVMPAVITPGPGKAMGKDAALQIVAKDLADIGLGCVVVALAIELTCAGEFMPGLKVFCNRLVEQRALRVARVVEFGLCIRWPACIRVRVRWAGRSWRQDWPDLEQADGVHDAIGQANH